MNISDNGHALQNNTRQAKSADYSPREFLMRYMHYLPWFVLSCAVCLLVSYLYLRYATPIYTASGRMILKKQASNGTHDRFEDIFMMQGASNLNDEMEQIKSSSIGKRVVKALNLQTTYYNKGNIRVALMTSDESPLKLNVRHMPDSASTFSMEITVIDEHRFRLNERSDDIYFNQPFQVDKAMFTLERTGIPLEQFAKKVFVITWQPEDAIAKTLAKSINIAQSNDFSNVLTLSFESENPRLSQNLVNGFMSAYEEASLEEKRQIAINTLNFIEDQLDTLRRELGGVERNLQNFRQRNRALAVEEQSTLFLNNANELEKKDKETEVQMKVIDYLISYIGSEKNYYKMVPSTLGISEPSLLQSITEYNRLQLQRETYSKTMPAANPVMVDIETGLAKLRSNMLENLRNVRQAYLVTLNNLQRQNQATEKELGSIPGKQKQLLEITRQQKILEELYSFLLQKKLETSIGAASTVSNSRIIEAADYSMVPVKPKHKSAYLLGLFIGLAIPVGVVFLKELLNDKVTTRSDVEKVTQAPILGEVGHSENSSSLIISANNRSYVAEQFRMIRSNLQYFVPKNEKPVILVTSSFSGEGKSFVSTNLAAVLALSGKKTLILEFDIRKPKILKGMGLSESRGITNFIVSNLDLNQILIRVPSVENLYVIPCGPIPPNPAELLLDSKVDELFEFALENFDAVVVDTAPVGLVSDAIVLGKKINSSVYIVRNNYTFKRQLHLVEDIYQQQKLPRMALVVNDVKPKKGYGYYGHGYGYGYGYGYAHGDDYFDFDKKKKKKRKGLWRYFS